MISASTMLGAGTGSLQATLAAASGSPDGYHPHHPISCATDLRLEDDGALACEHAVAPAGDRRTQMCIDHSIALLILELGAQR